MSAKEFVAIPELPGLIVAGVDVLAGGVCDCWNSWRARPHAVSSKTLNDRSNSWRIFLSTKRHGSRNLRLKSFLIVTFYEIKG